MKTSSFIFILIALLFSVSQANPILDVRLERQVNRAAADFVNQANNKLIKAVSNLQTSPTQLRRYLQQGADPCRALPFAVFAKNVAAIPVLAEFKSRCNWTYAVEQRLPYMMKNNLVSMFRSLMQHSSGVTCPNPFNFTPGTQKGKPWQALSREMLVAVNENCFRTPAEKARFLRGLILLNPEDRTIFALGENYHYAIPSSPVQCEWMNSVKLLVKVKVKVSTDTLKRVISQSRITNVNGTFNLPFDTTRRLVYLCLEGGANGPAVLKWLDSDEGNWVWNSYNEQERKRLSNILEYKPEAQARSRSFVSRIIDWL